MATFINDIELDYSTEITRGISNNITEEDVQKTKKNNIVRHKKKKLREFTITCALIGDDREERFQRILELDKNDTLMTVIQDDTYENLLILELEETGKYIDTIEFVVTFKSVRLVEFETTEEPLPAKLQVIQDESTQGLQQTSEVNIEVPDYPTIGLTQE